MGASKSQQSPRKPQSEEKGSSSHPSLSLDPTKVPFNDHSQSRISSPLQLPMSNTYKCSQCGMVFPSDEALFKHRSRFCIGVMDSGIGRKVYYSDDEELNQDENNRSAFRQVVQHQSPVKKKREEINEWKNQRSVLQSVQDMEDRILRDSKKTQRLANDLKKRTHDYNEILAEYERLESQERDLLRQMFNLQGQPGSHFNQTNSLIDHERSQLEVLQRQNVRLEQERRVIQNKLEELIASDHQPSTVSNYEPYKLLRDMKDEQDRNEKALIYLRRRLVYPNSDISSLPYLNSPRRTTADSVRTLRNGYLQFSHHDSNIFAHHSNLERRLRDYEYYPWLRGYPEPLKHLQYRSVETPTDRLISAKHKNQRLQNELENMERKFEKLDSRTRQLELTLASSGTYDHKPNGSHNYPSTQIDHHPPIRSINNTSTRQVQRNYNNQVFDQHQQYHQSVLPSLDRRITTSHVTQSMTNFNSNLNRLRDPLGPQLYDQTAGFVIFFDFIINLPSTIDQCRLITCLHYPDSGLGEPSPLQSIKCALYTNESTSERMNGALIGTKQPVPSCPPQPLLTNVIEIQVTHKQTPNEILRTNAWLKLPLFDHRNRLLSGRWKVPLKMLPINHSETFKSINTLPSYERAELYYRLVNFRDAFDQSNVPLSPALRDLYFYPPQYRNGSYM